jgi:hypothetical protein
MARTGLFLGGIAALGGVGAGILQMIGPPLPVDDSAQDERADAIFVEFASRVPTVAADAVQVAAVETPSDADQASTPPAVEASTEPEMMVASETTSAIDPAAAPLDAWTVMPYLRMPVDGRAAISDRNETGAGTRREAPRTKTRLLRITRDHKLCPQVVCYKWHLVTQRAKIPRGATIDLAQLRLAPSLREATENGKVDLIINATETRKPASGRGNVIFVATSLFGVTPHDETP